MDRLPKTIEWPPPVSAKKVGFWIMATEFKRLSCAICGHPLDSDGLQDQVRTCEACAASAWRRKGTVLRHWTTNGPAFVGKATTAAVVGDRGLADSRRISLIGSKLKSLASGVGAL
jgi:hypothetical protein